MVVSGQNVSAKPTCHSNDKPQSVKQAQDGVPASWKLTQQQQAFIDSFAPENEKKR